jgi:hypothetical protein
MISPEHINAFFGVDLVTEMNSMNLEVNLSFLFGWI